MGMIAGAVRGGAKEVLIRLGMNNLPDFLIIGAQKAGTSSLKYFLSCHPQIIGAGEIPFFHHDGNYSLGLRWFQRQLPVRIDPRKLLFQKKPEYIYYPEVAERIYQFNRAIKLILCVREPVSRAFSGWYHYYRYFTDETQKQRLLVTLRALMGENKAERLIRIIVNGENYPAFADFVREELELIAGGIFCPHPAIVARGLYMEQIRHYLKFFSSDQLMIIENRELKNDSLGTLNRIAAFLGVRPFVPGVFDMIDQNVSAYRDVRIDSKSAACLKDFYRPHNEALFDFLGKKYDW